jgi:maltose-binding protein MalE
MKKFFIFGVFVLSIFCLSGCGNKNIENKTKSVEVREGKLTVRNGEVYLLSTENGIVNITSNKVNLDNYLKKNIKVTGMFSGDTLYIDELEEN